MGEVELENTTLESGSATKLKDIPFIKALLADQERLKQLEKISEGLYQVTKSVDDSIGVVWSDESCESIKAYEAYKAAHPVNPPPQVES